MAIDKSLISGNTDMLILKLLEKQDMYGYQMIEELAKQSDHTFELKAGTLYPLLHLLEQKQYSSFDIRQLRHLYEAVSCHNPTFL